MFSIFRRGGVRVHRELGEEHQGCENEQDEERQQPSSYTCIGHCFFPFNLWAALKGRPGPSCTSASSFLLRISARYTGAHSRDTRPVKGLAREAPVVAVARCIASRAHLSPIGDYPWRSSPGGDKPRPYENPEPLGLAQNFGRTNPPTIRSFGRYEIRA